MITKDQALKIAKNHAGWVHNFRQAGNVLVGRSFTWHEFCHRLLEAKRIEIGGEQCQSIRHALVLDRVEFFETVDNFWEIIKETGGEYDEVREKKENA